MHPNRTHLKNLAAIMKALPGTQEDIKRKTGLGTGTCSRYLSRLERECKIAVINRVRKPGSRKSSGIYGVNPYSAPRVKEVKHGVLTPIKNEAAAVLHKCISKWVT